VRAFEEQTFFTFISSLQAGVDQLHQVTFGTV
jgi:hypothetical protein